MARGEDVQDVAVLVHCSPKIVPFAADRDEQFVHVPDVPKSALSPPERVGVGGTGAEIKECCRKAYRLKLSLKESAEYIVPVSRSAAEQIKALRQQASGKFISASCPGVYQFQESTLAQHGGRAFRALEG